MKRRWQTHCSDAKANRYEVNHFHRAIRKYGPDSFTHEILESNIDKDLLDSKEVYYIEYYKSYEKGYNSDIGGKTRKGFIHSSETKKKISNKLKGKYTTVMTSEIKNKISETLSGRKLSQEHKENITKYGINNNNFKPWAYITPDGTYTDMSTTTVREYAKTIGVSYSTILTKFYKDAERGKFLGYKFFYISKK